MSAQRSVTCQQTLLAPLSHGQLQYSNPFSDRAQVSGDVIAPPSSDELADRQTVMRVGFALLNCLLKERSFSNFI